MHTAEVIIYSDGPSDDQREEKFRTVSSCITWIEFMVSGRVAKCRAWIDNVEVILAADGTVNLDDGTRVDLVLMKPYLGLQPGAKMRLNPITAKVGVDGGIMQYVKE